jgi:uncharacterized protein YbjT (DUF2867 family)
MRVLIFGASGRCGQRVVEQVAATNIADRTPMIAGL